VRSLTPPRRSATSQGGSRAGRSVRVGNTGPCVSVAENIPTHRQRPTDGGIENPPEPDAAAYYALIVAWGDAHGLPSDAAYAERLEAACPPTGRRGRRRARMSVERLRLAETARAWRSEGWPEQAIAVALYWRGEPPSPQLLEKYNERLKQLEHAIRRLEKVEGRPSPPRPPRDTTAARAASVASVARARAAAEVAKKVKLRDEARLVPNDEPALLGAWARELRCSVMERRALDTAGIPRVRGPRDAVEQEEMLALAEREESRATRLRRHSQIKGLSTRAPGEMHERDIEALLADGEYDIEPVVKLTVSDTDDPVAAWEATRARREARRP
jgi:hypothetical protein